MLTRSWSQSRGYLQCSLDDQGADMGRGGQLPAVEGVLSTGSL